MALERVAEVRQQLGVLPPHHGRARITRDVGVPQVGAHPLDKRVDAGGIGADGQRTDHRMPDRVDPSRRQITGRKHHAHAVHPGESPKGDALALHAVLCADQRKSGAGRAAAGHGSPAPALHHLEAVLDLHCDDQHVVEGQVDFFGSGNDRNLQVPGPTRGGELQPRLRDAVPMCSACHQHDRGARGEQARPDRSADGSGPDHDVSHPFTVAQKV